MIGIAQSRALMCVVMLAGSIALAGCGASASAFMTPQHVDEYGTVVFEAPPDTVFRACVLALQMSGQRVQVAEKSTGLVVTWPDAVAPLEIRPPHGYVVEVRPSPGGRATVLATPTLLPDEDAIRRGTPPPRWELDREREAWGRLFTDIRSLVDREQGEAP